MNANKCFIALGFLLSFACNETGNPELSITFYLNEYLDNGELNRASVFRSGAEGLFFDFDWQWFYEDDGRTIRVELGRDGVFEEFERFEYDDLGR